MPVYTYRCANCGTELDHHQDFNDPPLTLCPSCKQEKMQRVYKPIRVIFKGSGFYATDHRSPSGGNLNGQNTTKSTESETTKTAPESSTTTTAKEKTT